MLRYQIEGCKLWIIRDSKSMRARAQLECVMHDEAKELAHIKHATNGHFGHDLIKIALLDHVCSPKLDKSIVTAIVECGHCKAFGGQHLATLLEPITRCHPWESLAGDYPSMLIGKGGFHTICLYMDIFSHKIFRLVLPQLGLAIFNKLRIMQGGLHQMLRSKIQPIGFLGHRST